MDVSAKSSENPGRSGGTRQPMRGLQACLLVRSRCALTFAKSRGEDPTSLGHKVWQSGAEVADRSSHAPVAAELGALEARVLATEPRRPRCTSCIPCGRPATARDLSPCYPSVSFDACQQIVSINFEANLDTAQFVLSARPGGTSPSSSCCSKSPIAALFIHRLSIETTCGQIVLSRM